MMESYTDDKNDNKWKTVNQLIDSGYWHVNNTDRYYMVPAGSNRSKDYILEIQNR